MNREERRALKKKLPPKAREIARLENLAKDPSKKEECEAQISAIMDSMSLMEMMAIEDYIMSKGLLNNFDTNNK
jgi:hypothetical protein